MDPLVFEPYFRPQVWGHRRLERVLGKKLPPEGKYGEAWEVSAHPHHVNRVADGPFRGTPLTELCGGCSKELYGEAAPEGGHFPWLIKLLDCHELLSIQVHPTDELAPKLAGEASGKTEAWVVLDVEPGGTIYAGLKPGLTPRDLERHLEAKTLEKCLHSFTPKPGDCVFLAAGTVHAVGGGVLMAEVQQSSDATFRLYDWNRPGPDGKLRQLHIRESLESINWDAGPVHPAKGPAIPGLPAGVTGEELVRCGYFHMDRYRIAGPFPVPFACRLSAWVVLDGTAELRRPESGYRRTFCRGETVLIPAAAGELTWAPADGTRAATLLGVCLP